MSKVIGADLRDSLMSHAMSLGLFDSVNGHEPKSAPGNGITASFWCDTIDPIPQASGLATTSLRVSVICRLDTNMTQEPQDDIDSNMIDAAVALVAAYSGDFQLDSTVMEIDLLGGYGQAQGFKFGFLDIDKIIHRVATLTIPVIYDDAINQEA